MVRAALAVLLAATLSVSTDFIALAEGPGGQSGTDQPIEYPTDMPAIGVAVTGDGLNSQGRWIQTVRLTIQPGGTLSDASLVAFGDTDHVDAIFAAAHQKNPTLVAPAMVPAGQEIDLTIDASTTFVLQTVLHSPNQLVQRFTNGAVSTEYSQPNGTLQRVITFPDNHPTDLFVFPASGAPLKVRPGGKIVDLTYVAGQSFSDLVKQTYGLTNYATAADFTAQTGWEPTHWPPANGAVKQIIVGALASYETSPTDVGYPPNPDPLGRQREAALHLERRQAGVYGVRLESFDEVYHVAVSDPNLTASQLSTLLYGSPDHRVAIATAAGFSMANGAAAAVAAFDPHLYGRAFDLAINYEDEQFIIRRVIAANGSERLDLADGAQVTTYPNQASGPLLMVSYPTGYKRIVYRPAKTILTIAQGLALFHAANALDLTASQADSITRRYTAEVIWRWAPGIPRLQSDTADSLNLVDSPAGSYIDVIVAPPGPQTVVDRAVDLLRLQNPFAGVVILVVGGMVLVLLLDLTRRTIESSRRVRW
jgi:hypothetical protein